MKYAKVIEEKVSIQSAIQRCDIKYFLAPYKIDDISAAQAIEIYKSIQEK